MVETIHYRLAVDYVADLVARTHALEELAKRLALLEDYVSAEVPALIGKFAAAAAIIRRSSLEEFQRYRRTGDSKDLTLLRSIDLALQELFLDVRLPERARSDRVPGVLSRLVSKKAGQILPGAAIILRPQWRYNYKIYRSDVQTRYRTLFAPIFPSLASIENWLTGLPDPLYIISFPLIEHRSIRMHALLGHELGHLMARSYVAPGNLTGVFEKSIRSERLTYLRNTRPDLKEESNDAILEGDTDIEKSIDARNTAIKEYAADAAAVYILGVPAVLATAQLAMSRSPRQSREGERGTYPTWGNRLVFMMQQVEDVGWDAALEKLTRRSQPRVHRAISALRDRLAAIRQWVGTAPHWTVGDRWVRKGHGSAEELLSDIRVFLKEKFAPSFADVLAATSALPTLLRRLDNSHPPDNLNASELPFKAASLDQIFLASWCHSLSSLEPTFTEEDLSEGSRESIESIRRLTLKAIENVDFMESFEARIGEESVSVRPNARRAVKAPSSKRKTKAGRHATTR
jgi:hypothetical protein